MKRPRMFVLGWASEGTGFTRVLNEILRPLTTDYEIHQVGVGYYGPKTTGEWSLYPCDSDGSDMYGVFAAQELIEQLRPEILFILHDIWMFEYYFRILKPQGSPFKTVVYFPLDGVIRDVELARPLLSADQVVTYTAGAAEETRRAMEAVAESSEALPDVHVVPHGVDMQQFYPLSESVGGATLKEEVFPDLGSAGTSFIVLNASRPAVRKRLDISLRGFALFAQNKPENVQLCLHHAKGNKETHTELSSLASELGILDRIIWNPLSDPGVALSDERLNRLYNACDVGLNTSTGEGWGLVSCEHASVGKPQVVPDHSACSEIWENAAALVEPALREIPTYSPLEMAEVPAEGVAEALERLYQDRAYAGSLGLAGQQRMRTESWQWPVIAEQWRELLRRATLSQN